MKKYKEILESKSFIDSPKEFDKAVIKNMAKISGVPEEELNDLIKTNRTTKAMYVKLRTQLFKEIKNIKDKQK